MNILEKWVMPQWMIPFAGKFVPHKGICETHMNTGDEVTVYNNAPLALMVVTTKNEVQLLTKLYEGGFLNTRLCTDCGKPIYGESIKVPEYGEDVCLDCADTCSVCDDKFIDLEETGLCDRCD